MNKEHVMPYVHGKAEGTARIKALRWDAKDPSKVRPLRVGREQR